MEFNLRAPAKLNLWLKITGRRPNGYHELDSLFVPTTLADEIKARTARVDRVIFKDSQGHILSIEDDTVTRAVKIFRDEFGATPGMEWEITKNIPTAAGLGGGSSDGASALRFLASQFAPKIQREALEQAALKLGADVPFFLQSKPALVSGVGEILRPVAVEKMFFVIAKPPFGISTKEAYRWFDEESVLTQGGNLGTPRMINEVSGWQDKGHKVFSVREIVENLTNDFEPPVKARFPEIEVMKKALRTWGALGSLMSGTGSSIYGIFSSLSLAISARESLQQSFPSHYAFFICETLA